MSNFDPSIKNPTNSSITSSSTSQSCHLDKIASSIGIIVGAILIVLAPILHSYCGLGTTPTSCVLLGGLVILAFSYLAIGSTTTTPKVSANTSSLTTPDQSPVPRDEFGRTPLHIAVLNNNPEKVRELLQQGLSPNDPILKTGDTSLQLACLNGYDECFYLLSQDPRANFAVTNSQKQTLLHLTVTRFWTPPSEELEEKKLNILSILLTKKLDPNAKDNAGWTPLLLATDAGHAKIVQKLLESGASPTIVTKNQDTALHLAAGSSFELTKLLLPHFAINSKNKKGETPLHRATEGGSYETVSHLMEKKADASIVTQEGKNIFHYAAGNFDKRVLELFLADSSLLPLIDKPENTEGKTPLLISASSNNTDFAQLLLETHPDKINVNYAIPSTQSTALHSAASKGNLALVTLLLNHQAFINQENYLEETPLFKAVSENINDDDDEAFNVASLLLQKGAEIKNAFPPGCRSLGEGARTHSIFFRPVSSNYIKTFTLLLEHGAPLKIVNNPTLFLAENNNLIEKIGKREEKEGRFFSTFHLCAASGRTEMMKKMIEKDRHIIDLQDEYGFTALHRAIWNRQSEAIQFLIENGASLHVADNNGKTPKDLAQQLQIELT